MSKLVRELMDQYFKDVYHEPYSSFIRINNEYTVYYSNFSKLFGVVYNHRQIIINRMDPVRPEDWLKTLSELFERIRDFQW